ncbi:MAG: hypothetical protein LBH05_07585 [Deferribacteraceae bacterium]|jgi:hypothetical protein|nr:hypothetical protein [Deferribacteraceae bacterium]
MLDIGVFSPTANSMNVEEDDKEFGTCGVSTGLKFAHYFSENIGITPLISYNGVGGGMSIMSLACGVATRFPLGVNSEFFFDGGLSYNNNAIDNLKFSGYGAFIDTGARYVSNDGFLVGLTLRYSVNNQKYEMGGLSIMVSMDLTTLFLVLAAMGSADYLTVYRLPVYQPPVYNQPSYNYPPSKRTICRLINNIMVCH